MSLERKSRSDSVNRPSSYQTYRTAGLPLITEEQPVKLWWGQITDSEGHPGYNNPYSGFDTGGDFYSERRYIDAERSKGSYSGHDVSGTGLHSLYSGALTCSPSINPSTGIPMPINSLPGNATGWSSSWPSSLASSDSFLDTLGATAVARCKPTKSPASVSVALAEIFRDGLPHLVGAQAWAKKSQDLVSTSGKEYLNVVFGWQPFISDIKKTASAIVHWDDLVTQYERDAGRLVRRRFDFPIEKSTSDPVDLGLGHVWQNQREFQAAFRTAKANLFRRETTYRRIWFSGAFTYHLPIGFNSRNEMVRLAARAGHFLGLEPTPENIWNATPWTWALGWFSNFNNVISNVSEAATDGLVMPYGYVMEHTIHTYEYWIPHIEFKSGTGTPPFTVCVTETKKRRRASPFGFGLNWDNFTPRQLAILAALGVSRFG